MLSRVFCSIFCSFSHRLSFNTWLCAAVDSVNINMKNSCASFYIRHVVWVCPFSKGMILLHPFNVLFSRTTFVSQHQKSKPLWILMKQEMIRWQWRQLDNMQIICTSLQTDNHASTFHSNTNCCFLHSSQLHRQFLSIMMFFTVYWWLVIVRSWNVCSVCSWMKELCCQCVVAPVKYSLPAAASVMYVLYKFATIVVVCISIHIHITLSCCLFVKLQLF